MAERTEQFRPYAAPANVIGVFNRARTLNLPEIINNNFLRISGVPEGAWYKVMQALQFLGLIHEDGRPTETFDGLAGATDSRYKELLENVVREAYRAEFTVVDPGQDPQPRIVDAFRPYKPRSQTNRMVILFQGLCREAGIPVLDAPRERRMREPQAKRPKSTVEKRSIGVPTKRIISERTIVPTTSGVLFGVTEDDVAVLGEAEFNEVWTALGKVARARAQAKRQAVEKEATTEETNEVKSE
jgi:hypothetical protein